MYSTVQYLRLYVHVHTVMCCTILYYETVVLFCILHSNVTILYYTVVCIVLYYTVLRDNSTILEPICTYCNVLYYTCMCIVRQYYQQYTVM